MAENGPGVQQFRHSVRARLLATFVLAIVFTMALGVVFVTLNRRVAVQYRDIAERLITENRFAGIFPEFLDAYLEVINAGRDDEARIERYQALRRSIDDHIEFLDRNVTDPGSRVAYLGLRNFVLNVAEQCDRGIQAIHEGRISQATKIYTEEVAPIRPFVHENIAKLLGAELKVAERLEGQVRNEERFLDTAYGVLFLFIFLLDVLAVMLIARGVTRPIRQLSTTAQRIAGGDLGSDVDSRLLGRKDEIGSLANSFKAMLDRLRAEIEYQKEIGRELARKSQELETSRVEFISLATHQLKTPITGLKWSLDAIADEQRSMDPAAKAAVADMREIVRILGELVNALLNVSRLELGNYAVIPEPVDLRERLADIVKLVQPDVARKKLDLQVTIDPKVPATYDADPQVVDIIFQNLLSNAVKYTQGGGRVEVRLMIKGSALVYQVTDTGIGIPADQQEKIFTKMFRANNTGEEEGTGLGLFMVRRIAEGIGGAITFVSKEGKGTTFTVTLPKSGMPAKSGTRRLT